jgi:hypothetical protein
VNRILILRGTNGGIPCPAGIVLPARPLDFPSLLLQNAGDRLAEENYMAPNGCIAMTVKTAAAAACSHRDGVPRMSASGVAGPGASQIALDDGRVPVLQDPAKDK